MNEKDTSRVRSGEEINPEALSQFLRTRLETTAGNQLSIEIEQFPGGHSNLTYLVRIDGQEYVLRRPPMGPVAPTAHDMPREFRMLSAINPVFPLAPRPLLLCEDTEVIGVPFYLMERRRGLIIRREVPPELGNDISIRRRISESMIDRLADLHLIDLEEKQLTHLGKPSGFVARQVKGWSERWQRSKTSEVPAMEKVVGWLADNLPADPARPTLLHNDYKLDNVMLDFQDPSRIVAILDWEMCALGDPLVDLGLLLCYWSQKGDSEARRESISAVTTEAGWLSRPEMIERYAARTGFDVSKVAYYEILAIFKLAVVVQQIFYRYHRGQTNDERFAEFGRRAIGLAETAWDLACGGIPGGLGLNLSGRHLDQA